MEEEHYDASTNRIPPEESQAKLFGGVGCTSQSPGPPCAAQRTASQPYDHVSHYPRSMLSAYQIFFAYCETTMAEEMILRLPTCRLRGLARSLTEWLPASSRGERWIWPVLSTYESATRSGQLVFAHKIALETTAFPDSAFTVAEQPQRRPAVRTLCHDPPAAN
ncbi:hypothetical protein MKX08_004732 [Trichoderma sp. CBMAI-0020]|nr:hypothetical protein MKX08_004732 [Trichoderma sp. CBMAI-0020]